MESLLCPGFVYEDTERGITEHDLDVVSDLWTIDEREVYRGARDPRYTHANVYWLYSETFERVGLSEHSLADHANYRSLWYQDSDFGTFLQEEGWTTPHDLWSMLPRPVVDKWINDEISTPEAVATECLRGPLRILVPSMLEVLPIVWECTTCGQRAFKPKAGCSSVARPYDLPERKRVVFVDDDLIVHVPPPGSTVWLRLEQLQHGGGSSQAQAQEPEPVQESERTAPSLPPQAEPTPRPHTPETLQAPSSPPQSRLQTPAQP